MRWRWRRICGKGRLPEMNLFTRARLNLNLTPAERAFLRLVEGTLIGAVVAGAQAILPMFNDAALAQPDAIAWGTILHTFLAAFGATLILAARKYLAARADPALPTGSTVSVSPLAPAAPAQPTASNADPEFPPGISADELQAQLAPAA